ncbi:D-alanyl-D-alanine carboxypeptidase [Candidatus Giovannonibacteria bacterium]|nr:D-alanyl-D-alanine carboxypeptidase [Candidatus Giovannonibacteria bacterium]
MAENNSKIVVAMAALAVFVYFMPAQKISSINQAASISNILLAETKEQEINAPLPPEIDAKSALAEDFVTGKIYFAKNKDLLLPLASLTKILTALVALDRLSLDEVIQISKTAINAPETSFLKIGEHFLARDLLSMAMVASSNDAIEALYEAATDSEGILTEFRKEWFLSLMRQKAESFGARDMVFNNTTGYDVSESLAGGYGSAEDILKIAKGSLDSPIWQFGGVREIYSKEKRKHILKPTNELYGELPELIGAKTGFTDLAGGNLLVVVEYPLGHPVGIVVLGSTEEGRFTDVKKILNLIKSK